MGAFMGMDYQLEQWLADEIPSDWLLTPLPNSIAHETVERLKQEADRYWFIDPHRSLELANRIVAIGQARDDAKQIALGYMAAGDALKFLGRIQEAWEKIEHAGQIFQGVGDEVGWARTRIGRLYLAVKLNHVRETLADGVEAKKIFTRHRAYELLVRLNSARAVVYGSLGNVRRALRLLYSALAVAETLGTDGQRHLGQLYLNIGVAHEVLGDFSQALIYYERAHSIFIAHKEARNIAIIEINIAYIAQAQGHYRHSLNLLHGILERGVDQFPMEYLAVKRDMTECYLYLNRYAEVCDLAQQVVEGYRKCDAAYETARSLLHQATAEAESGSFQAAYDIFREAEQIFADLGATSWQALTCLRRGRTSLKQGDTTGAIQDAQIASADFKLHGQQVNYAAALMLKAQALYVRNDLDEAADAVIDALRIARHYSVPSLLYTGQLLLGQTAEARGKIPRAIRRYQAATATIERVQRGLTITLRPGFLEDKGEASRSLIALYLQAGRAGKAFEAVEHAKSQVLLGYLLNREDLHWDQTMPQARTLLNELNLLRAEHQWFYRQAHDPPRRGERPNSTSIEQAFAELAARERRMRAIVEQLYLHGGQGGQAHRVPVISLSDIQSMLASDTLLVEFYIDGNSIRAFVVDRQTIECYLLPLPTNILRQLLAQLRANVGAAFSVPAESTASYNLTHSAQRILERLSSALIQSLELNKRNPRRLMIVPYGPLHYLPFHLLYDGSTYLIEKHEVVILPTASLATRPIPSRKPGALVLAHSFDGRLPHALAEAQAVHQIFGGAIRVEEAASRKTLQESPVQVLHIAAHGQHRLDHPDLSYLYLADGQLYADDLLQQDLSYELVTLSACETGQANVVASDELIGLARGFLYAGAGALIVSHWQVADDSTLDLMKQIYKNLSDGTKSKAAAVREAQQSMIAKNRHVHPAYWGAFQLMGNADPLSTPVE